MPLNAEINQKFDYRQTMRFNIIIDTGNDKSDKWAVEWCENETITVWIKKQVNIGEKIKIRRVNIKYGDVVNNNMVTKRYSQRESVAEERRKELGDERRLNNVIYTLTIT